MRDLAFAAFTVSAVVWACAGTYVAKRLRDGWPDAFAKAGSPTPLYFWFSRQLPNTFDRFTLLRRYRELSITDSEVLAALEIARFARWVQIICLIVLILGPATSNAPPSA